MNWPEWRLVLQEFQCQVNCDKYTKVEYSKYKILHKIYEGKVQLNFDLKALSVTITGLTTIMTFSRRDNSLGAFLFNKFCDEEGRIMDSIISTKIPTTNLLSVDTDNFTVNTSSCSYSLDSRPTFNEVEKMIDNKMKEKEKANNMKNFNFDFGPISGDSVRMSMYGLAVKNAAGVYVSYNPKTKEIIDVDILNFDGAKYMYKIPVALNAIAVGDIIVHNRKPMFVVALPTENSTSITCIDVCAGEEKLVIPTTNMFGFNFLTKIVSLFNTLGDNAPSPDAPFGNMLPLMLMDGNDEKIDPMMLMMMMNQKNEMFNNPMMMMLLMKNDNGKDSDWMKMMLLSQMMGQKSST